MQRNVKRMASITHKQFRVMLFLFLLEVEEEKTMSTLKELKGKKILILGCCGSGKSYFSRELAHATGLPLYHLDKIRWRTDWTFMPREEFIPIIEKIMQEEKWIIDGNYLSTMELRLAYADTVFYFDIPTEECLANVEARKGKTRSDMPDGMTDRDDPEFIGFIENFKSETAPQVEALLEKFGGEIIVFKSRADKDEYLRS